jgi:hypothetical protein
MLSICLDRLGQGRWWAYHPKQTTTKRERGKMIKQLNALLTNEIRRCELCGSDSWRVLHEGDESNCECEGECLRVCDNPDLSDEGCDGVAELVICNNCPSGNPATHEVITLSGELALCESCYND